MFSLLHLPQVTALLGLKWMHQLEDGRMVYVTSSHMVCAMLMHVRQFSVQRVSFFSLFAIQKKIDIF